MHSFTAPPRDCRVEYLELTPVRYSDTCSRLIFEVHNEEAKVYVHISQICLIRPRPNDPDTNQPQTGCEILLPSGSIEVKESLKSVLSYLVEL